MFLRPRCSSYRRLLFAAVVPFGSSITVAGYEIPLQIADINIGILYILAITSLGVYGVVLGAWASNNKYSLLGGTAVFGAND